MTNNVTLPTMKPDRKNIFFLTEDLMPTEFSFAIFVYKESNGGDMVLAMRTSLADAANSFMRGRYRS